MGKRTVVRARRKMGRGLIRVAIYLRVSTPSQVEKFGLSAQKTTNIAWLDRQLGRGKYTIVDVYSDGGVSGKLASRPDFDRMNADIAAGLIDLVVFGKLDRVGRTMKDIHRWCYDTTEVGVRIATADDRIDSHHELFEIQLSLLAYVAQLEHQMILERTMAGREQKAAAGGWPLGQPPYGVVLQGQAENAVPVLCEDECSVINYACIFLIDEGLTRDEAAEKINLLGYRTRSGKEWTGSNLAKRLDTTALDGYVEFSITVREYDEDDLVDGEIPVTVYRIPVPTPIADPARVIALRKALNRRSFVKSGVRNAYLLTGRMNAMCGSHYTGGKAQNEQAYYRCMGKRDESIDCDCRELPALEVEQAVWSKVTELLDDKEKFRGLIADWLGNTPDRIASYERRLAELDRQIDEAKDGKKQRLLSLLEQLSATDDEDFDLATIASLKSDLGVADKKRVSQLTEERERVASWLKDAEDQQKRAVDLLGAVESMADNLDAFAYEKKHALLDLLDVRVQVTGPMPHAPHKGKNDPLAAWHRETNTPVPAGPLTDEQWAVVSEILPAVRRQANVAPQRELFEAIASKLRTESSWKDVVLSQGAWNAVYRRAAAWHAEGVWERAMQALGEVCEMQQLRPRYILPPMEVTGAVDPRYASDRAMSRNENLMVEQSCPR